MIRIVLTCEHAGSDIPEPTRPLFRGAAPLLRSHRGVDIGACLLFDALTGESDFALSNRVSRLVVDLNRSVGHPQLFSEFTRSLNSDVKNRLLKEIYYPYRNRVESAVEKFIAGGDSVVHISVHTFTPVLNGVRRRTDIGLLYDPKNIRECDWCDRWRSILRGLHPGWTIRMNYPYRGSADGFTRSLRRRFPLDYVGVELEVNQKFFLSQKKQDIVVPVRQTLSDLRKKYQTKA